MLLDLQPPIEPEHDPSPPDATLRTTRSGEPVDTVRAAQAQLAGWASRGRGPAHFVAAGRLWRDHGPCALLYVSALRLPAETQRRVSAMLRTAGCTLAPDEAQMMMEV